MIFKAPPLTPKGKSYADAAIRFCLTQFYQPGINRHLGGNAPLVAQPIASFLISKGQWSRIQSRYKHSLGNSTPVV